MTKLEAVNIMLRSIQESAVNSLESGIIDAETAETILEEAKTRILSKGWSVNSDTNVLITRDMDGKINMPSTALRMDATDPQQSRIVPTNGTEFDLVPRDDEGTQRMWDRQNQTFVLDQDVYFDIVYDLEFEDLPLDYQWYIATCGAEDLQQQTIGSVVLDKFLRNRKAEAWASMQDAEDEQQDNNVLRDSESVRNLAWRNNRRALA